MDSRLWPHINDELVTECLDIFWGMLTGHFGNHINNHINMTFSSQSNAYGDFKVIRMVVSPSLIGMPTGQSSISLSF